MAPIYPDEYKAQNNIFLESGRYADRDIIISAKRSQRFSLDQVIYV